MSASQATNPAASTRERALWWAARRHCAESAVRRWHPATGEIEPATDERLSLIIDQDLGRTHTGAAQRYARRRKLAHSDEHRALLAQLPDNWRVLLGLPGSAIESLATRLGLEMVALSVCVIGPDKALKAVLGVVDGREADLLVTRVDELAGQKPPDALAAQWPRRVAQAGQRLGGTKLLRTLGLTQLAALMHKQMDAAQQAVAGRHCRSQLIAVLRSAAPDARLGNDEARLFEPVLKDLLGQVSGGRA